MSNDLAAGPEAHEAELLIGPSAIDAYSRLSYSMWFALAEFVDNSTQSRLNYDGLVHDILKGEGVPLTVNIVHDRVAKEIRIEDNSIGMTKDDLKAALRIASPTADSKGRSKYGMGMKTSACWIGADSRRHPCAGRTCTSTPGRYESLPRNASGLRAAGP